MDSYGNVRIKWPSVTHMVPREAAAGLLSPVEEINPGALMLARMLIPGRHEQLEDVAGRRMSLFPGDVFVAALGNRYATDQFEGLARCSGTQGHILGIGGVCGEVVAMNAKMTEPTIIEWIGRLAGRDGSPLHLSSFRVPRAAARRKRGPVTILSLGASMNSGKTTTAARVIRSLSGAGHRVAAAKITGTACFKDPLFFRDAGAETVVDFTHAGWPSTAGCSKEDLLTIARDLRGALEARRPDFVILEIADGIVQKETADILSDEAFRASIDGVLYAGGDALTCESGVRRLRELGYTVLGTAGIVSNSRLGVAEVEATCGVRCYDAEAIFGGELLPLLEDLARSKSSRARRAGHGSASRPAPEEQPATRFAAAGAPAGTPWA